MKKGAVFDLDGTLVYSPGLHVKAWKYLFEKYQILLTKEELIEQSGKTNIAFINNVLERRSIKSLSSEKLNSQKDEIVINFLKVNPPVIFPKEIKFLQLLRLKGIKISLATNATQKTALVLGQQIINFFDYKVFAEDVSQGKPNPEIFLKAASGIGLESKDCVVFEDTESGIFAAKSGGFFCVAINNKLGHRLSKADMVIESYNPDDLIRLFI